MQTLLAVWILFAIGLPIDRQKERAQTSGNQQRGDNASDFQWPAKARIQCAIQHDGTTIECEDIETEVPKFLTRLVKPENVPNIALVFVGLLGVGAAVLTLRKINTQADEMTLQRVAMQDTLTAIKAQADLMKRQADAIDTQNKAVRDRERARISVVFPPEKPDFSKPSRMTIDEEPELMLPVTVALYNDGLSKAFGVRAKATFQFQEWETPFKASELLMDIAVPDVIRDEDAEHPVRLEIQDSCYRS